MNWSVSTSSALGSLGTTGSAESSSSYRSSHSSHARSSSAESARSSSASAGPSSGQLEYGVLEEFGLDQHLELRDRHREDAQPLIDLGRERDLLPEFRSLAEFHTGPPRDRPSPMARAASVAPPERMGAEGEANAVPRAIMPHEAVTRASSCRERA
jgi:hypothetical protein